MEKNAADKTHNLPRVYNIMTDLGALNYFVIVVKTYKPYIH